MLEKRPEQLAAGLRFAGVCVVVFALAYVCLIVPRGAERVSPIWLPNAFVLALMLTQRRSQWRGLIAAGFLGDFLANLAFNDSLTLSAGLAVCNTLEFTAVAYGLPRIVGRKADMSRPRNIALYAAITAAASAGAAFLATLVLGGHGSGNVAANFFAWALADFMGLLIVTPCLAELFALRERGRRFLSRDGLTLVVLVVVALLTFLQTRYPLLYLVPPALLLVTWRLGLPGAAAGLLGTLAIAAVCTVFGRGPFAGIAGPFDEQILSLHVFLLVCYFISVPVAVQARRERQLKFELNQALDEARAEARKVRMAQSVARLGYWRLDLATGEIGWSDELYRIMGMPLGAPLSPEIVIARVHADDAVAWRARFDNALKDGQPYEQEVLRVITLDGETRYVCSRVVVEHNAAGKPQAVFGIMLDNTDAVREQLARQEAEARYSLIAEQAHDIIVRADMQGRILYISPACRVLGYEPEDLRGSDAADLLHPDDVARFADNTRKLLSDGVVEPGIDRQHRVRRRDGEYVWLEGNPSVIRDAEGRPTELLNVFRDVTARKAAEAELANKEAELKLVADHAPDLLVRLDTQDRVVYASEASRTFGYEPEEMIGRLRSEFVHPDDFRSYDEVLAAASAHDDTTPSTRQYRLRRGDGSWVWVEGGVTPLRDADGVVLGTIGLVRDITERRAAAQALADSEARYGTLAENVSDILVRFGPDGRIRYISEACRKIGLDPQQAIGNSILNVVAPGETERAQQFIGELFSGREIDPGIRRHHRIIARDGREVWLEGSPKLVRDETGKVVEVVSVYRDVTARREIEAALADSEAKFRLFAENAQDLVMRSDPDGRVVYMSPSCERLTGFAPSEIEGKTALEWVHPEDVPELVRVFQAQVQSRGAAPPVSVQYRIRTKDGRELWMESCPAATLDPATGLVAGVTDVARNITATKQLEADLRAAREEAEAAAQVKSEFLANMSHELRTPLTSVVGFTKLTLEQPDLQALTRSYVERVSDASRALLSAVNDILDFSKLEAGQITFRPEPTPVLGLARSALELFQPQAGAKDLNLTLDCNVAEDLAVMVDPDRMRQVLLNLIGNAVKFTEAGCVTLKVRHRKTAGRLDVEIRDTGAGIPADKLDRLFKRFSQVDGSLTRTGGTGLGLAICKGIVEGMGGTIGVRTKVGRGSTFHFSVPVIVTNVAATGEGAPAETIGFTGVRVLVADDHPTNRELVGLILAGVGAEVAEAEDGVQAVEQAASWPYDVILMDLRMPNLDGMGALQRIRGESGPNDATPILAFTADADPEMVARLVAAGFQGVVSKPVAPDELIAAIAQATDFAHDPEALAHAS